MQRLYIKGGLYLEATAVRQDPKADVKQTRLDIDALMFHANLLLKCLRETLHAPAVLSVRSHTFCPDCFRIWRQNTLSLQEADAMLP